LGKISEEVQIQTKSFIYKIPVHGYVLTNEEYEKLESENLQRKGKRLQINAKLYIKEVIINDYNIKLYIFRFQKSCFPILT